MSGCQSYRPLLGPLDTRCPIILRTQKGTLILTTTHIVKNMVLDHGNLIEVPEHQRYLFWGGPGMQADTRVKELEASQSVVLPTFGDSRNSRAHAHLL